MAPAPNVNAVRRNELITIRTPLYDAKFDSRRRRTGQLDHQKNKNSNGAEIFSVAGKKSDRRPLELISPEGLNRQPRLVPLQLQTGDAALDAVLASSTYRVEGVDRQAGDVRLISHGREKGTDVCARRPEWSSGTGRRLSLTPIVTKPISQLSVKRGEQVVSPSKDRDWTKYWRSGSWSSHFLFSRA